MRNGLKSLDVQRLFILNALLGGRTLTQVADAEGLTQPALSRILRQLREVLGDPLLVRSGSGMALTERAERMRAPLQEIIDHLASLEADDAFDPAHSERTFTIGCGDCISPLVISRIIHGILESGPALKVRTKIIDPSFDASRELETGAWDVMVSNRPKPREDLRTSSLYEDNVVCLMRPGHPLASVPRVTLARYLNARHLAPNQSTTREKGPIDGPLARAGYARNIVATIPEFNLVVPTLAESDLIFTAGRRFADYYEHTGIAIVPGPAEIPSMKFYQLWHQRKHTDASNRWLRGKISAASIEAV